MHVRCQIPVRCEFSVVAPHGALAGHRLGIELGLPVYQNLNGPQMAGDWMLTVG